ncbi:MAG: ribosome hibernation-promoting factor, HPF/YfiA family [Candidatus Aminicenantales bacterium]
MNIHFKARQMDLTPELKQDCERKLRKLEKIQGAIQEVDVILSVAKARHKAELHLTAKGLDLVVVEETSDMVNSLNLAVESLEKKIRKEREKMRDLRRRPGREREAPIPPEEGEEPQRRIVRSANYSMKPMSVEEAALHLDMKNREVYVFRKEGSEKWAVLFRRKDGNIGLVEPE